LAQPAKEIQSEDCPSKLLAIFSVTLSNKKRRLGQRGHKKQTKSFKGDS